MPHALVIRHMYSGSLFTIEEVFHRKGITFEYAEGFAQDLSRLDPLKPDIMVVLGGAMGVYDQTLYPWIGDEIALIQKRVEIDKPLLGICLGAQLMAASQGCRVYKGLAGREFGFLPIDLTDSGKDSPLRRFDRSSTRILQMHGDTFDLPANATLLASSPQYKNQAYRLGRNGFAVQFHPEFNRIGLENTLAEGAGEIDVVSLRADGQKYLPAMIHQTELFMQDLFDIWGV